LIVLQRKVRGRVQFNNGDRLFFVRLDRWFPSILEAMLIIRPEALVRLCVITKSNAQRHAMVMWDEIAAEIAAEAQAAVLPYSASAESSRGVSIALIEGYRRGSTRESAPISSWVCIGLICRPDRLLGA
jgi:hypothetical protein